MVLPGFSSLALPRSPSLPRSQHRQSLPEAPTVSHCIISYLGYLLVPVVVHPRPSASSLRDLAPVAQGSPHAEQLSHLITNTSIDPAGHNPLNTNPYISLHPSLLSLSSLGQQSWPHSVSPYQTSTPTLSTSMVNKPLSPNPPHRRTTRSFPNHLRSCRLCTRG